MKLAGGVAQELGTFSDAQGPSSYALKNPYAVKTLVIGVGEITQWLRVVADLLEDTRLVPMTHVR